MTQKPRTLPKMFNRRNGDTQNKSASTYVHIQAEPDTEDFYLIGESEESHLFADEEVIIVDEEEVWDNTRFQADQKTSPKMGNTRPQPVPPLPPKRKKGQGEGLVGGGILRSVDTTQSHGQSSLAPHKAGSQSTAMGGENNHQGQSSRKANSQEVSKPTAKQKPKQKRYRSKQFTERDKQILEAVYWLVKAPLNHIAFAVGVKPVLIHGRIRELDRRGYLKTDTTESLPTFSLTNQGLTQIGRSNEKAIIQIARSTFAHRNQINTATIWFKMGDKAFKDLMLEHEVTKMQEMIRNNRKNAESNESLAIHQQTILSKPESERTLADERVLARKPRSMRVIEEPVLGKHNQNPLYANPQASFPERLIQQSISDMGEPECVATWKEETDAWLHSGEFPVKQVGDSSVSDSDREAMYQASANKEWIFRHWNVRNEFKKRHMPDGIILQPHQQDTNGNILPMSFWLEVEANRKSDNSEYVRVIEQAFDCPVVRGVIYMTNDPHVATAVKKAIETVTVRLTHRYQQYEGMTHGEAQTTAQAFVKENCRLMKLPVLYPNQPTQFWG